MDARQPALFPVDRRGPPGLVVGDDQSPVGVELEAVDDPTQRQPACRGLSRSSSPIAWMAPGSSIAGSARRGCSPGGIRRRRSPRRSSRSPVKSGQVAAPATGRGERATEHVGGALGRRPGYRRAPAPGALSEPRVVWMPGASGSLSMLEKRKDESRHRRELCSTPGRRTGLVGTSKHRRPICTTARRRRSAVDGVDCLKLLINRTAQRGDDFIKKL